jgi:hypothetical protein
VAHSFAIPTPRPISLEEFADELRAYDVMTEDGIVAAADLFAALNANKTVLVDHIVRMLRDLRDDDRVNDYTGQTFLLLNGPNYYIRANAWLPPSYTPLKALSESDQFFYGLPHDHNFTFMTAGHVGAGYRTTVYEYDGIGTTYNVGDRADVRYLEDTMLPEGKVMVFRASRDIHIQWAPDEFSISLNLMTVNRTELARTQRVFDTDCATVKGHPRGNEASRQRFFALVPALADDRTEALLHDLLTSAHPGVRANAQGALDALASRAPVA